MFKNVYYFIKPKLDKTIEKSRKKQFSIIIQMTEINSKLDEILIVLNYTCGTIFKKNWRF